MSQPELAFTNMSHTQTPTHNEEKKYHLNPSSGGSCSRLICRGLHEIKLEMSCRTCKSVACSQFNSLTITYSVGQLSNINHIQYQYGDYFSHKCTVGYLLQMYPVDPSVITYLTVIVLASN